MLQSNSEERTVMSERTDHMMPRDVTRMSQRVATKRRDVMLSFFFHTVSTSWRTVMQYS